MDKEQLTININQQLAWLSSSGKWRKCQRKQYNVFAIQAPAGFVFANRLEQPEQYKYIKQRFNTNIVHVSKLTEADKAAIGPNCYVTDGTRIVICGTRGELWTVKPEKLASSYTNCDGTAITKAPKEWKEFSRAQENAPSGKGIQIPVKYLAVYEADWGVLKMNDLKSSGHYSGDILVVGNDGSVSTINNEVFAMTFNQQVGGWAQSSTITPVDKIREIKLEDVKKVYRFVMPVGLRKSNAMWKITELHKCGGTVLWYVLQDKDGKVADKQSKEDVIKIMNDKEQGISNARVQNYNGRDIIRIAKDSYSIVEEAVNTNMSAPESRKTANAEIITIWKKDIKGHAVGYTVKYKNKETKISRAKLIEYVKENRIANAKLQTYNGREIVRVTSDNVPVMLIDGGTADSATKAPISKAGTAEQKFMTAFLPSIKAVMTRLGLSEDRLVNEYDPATKSGVIALYRPNSNMFVSWSLKYLPDDMIMSAQAKLCRFNEATQDTAEELSPKLSFAVSASNKKEEIATKKDRFISRLADFVRYGKSGLKNS